MTAPAAPPAAPRRRPMRIIAGNMGWLLASNGLMAVLSLIYLGITSRTLGIVDFGRFALVTGACQTIASLLAVETWKIIVQYGLKHQADHDPDAVMRVQRLALLTDIAVALIGALLAILLFMFARPLIGIKGSIGPYALGYALIQVATIRNTPIGILRLHDRFDLAAMADSVTAVFRLIGALLALALMPTAKGFLIAWGVAEIATCIAFWLMVHRIGELRGLFSTRIEARRVIAENPGILRLMLNTNVQGLLALASRQMPLLVIGGYAGPAAAGGFRLALQLANALSKLATLLTRAAFPELVRQLRDAPASRIGYLIRRITLGSSLGALAVMLLVILIGQKLLVLIGGEQFAPAYVLLLWLAGGACVELAAVSFEPILMALHRPGWAMIARGAAVLFQIGAMVLIVPTLGAVGVAVSVFAGAVLTFIFLGLAVWRQSRGLSQSQRA